MMAHVQFNLAHGRVCLWGPSQLSQGCSKFTVLETSVFSPVDSVWSLTQIRRIA